LLRSESCSVLSWLEHGGDGHHFLARHFVADWLGLVPELILRSLNAVDLLVNEKLDGLVGVGLTLDVGRVHGAEALVRVDDLGEIMLTVSRIEGAKFVPVELLHLHQLLFVQTHQLLLHQSQGLPNLSLI
jgi:hypothetical protein